MFTVKNITRDHCTRFDDSIIARDFVSSLDNELEVVVLAGDDKFSIEEFVKMTERESDNIKRYLLNFLNEDGSAEKKYISKNELEKGDFINYNGEYYTNGDSDLYNELNLIVLYDGDLCNRDDACYCEYTAEGGITIEGYYRADDCVYGITGRRSGEGYIRDCDTITAADGTVFCSHEIANDNEYYQCESCSDFHPVESLHGENYYYCNDCYVPGDEDEDGLSDYDNGTDNLSGNSTLRIGFEIEKEDKEMRQKASELRSHGWGVVRDGSLDDRSGFELQSPILPLDKKYRGKLEGELRKAEKWIVASGTSKCGGHIHFSNKNKKPSELLKGIKGYAPLLASLYPSRCDNTYCEIKDFAEYGTKKYCMFRYSCNGIGDSLEFRLPPTPTTIRQCMFRADLLRICLQNPKDDKNAVLDALKDSESELSKLLVSELGINSPKAKIEQFQRFADLMSIN